MNIFVLGTGHCGTRSWAKACTHVENMTSAHESHAGWWHPRAKRLHYPKDHIEVDNRLSWHTGKLEEIYSHTAFYVHLVRERESCVESLVRNFRGPMIKWYANGMLLGGPPQTDREKRTVALSYYDTVNANISFFLRHHSRKLVACLETVKDDFRKFWYAAGLRGDLAAALSEFDIRHGQSEPARIEPI